MTQLAEQWDRRLQSIKQIAEAAHRDSGDRRTAADEGQRER